MKKEKGKRMEHDLKHLGIIMDGNGRWAKERKKPRTYGHSKGVDALERVLVACKELKIKHLTAFAFSTENWNRPEGEVKHLMMLFETSIKKFIKKAIEDKCRITFLGAKDKFSQSLQKTMLEAEKETSKYNDYFFNLAINYGGHEDITIACQKLAQKVKEGIIEPEYITPEMIENNLFTAGQPPLDMVIRTSGEQRISNFLLWQMAYAEILFANKNWPDFDKSDIEDTIKEFNKRTRRFGAIKED